MATMAIRWDWTDKMGECTMQGTKLNLYRGNAFVIALHEQGDRYSLAWFAADEQHMKNMLGLSKDYPGNDVADWGITYMKLDTRYKETTKLVQLLARAKMSITIELYEGGQDNETDE